MKRLLFIFTLLLLPCVLWAQFADDPAEPGNKYRLALVVFPADAGRVYGAGSYSKGTKVDVYTYANEGYTFLCWKKGDEVVSTSPSFYYVMPNVSTTLTAIFTKSGEGDGKFEPVDPSEPNSPGNGSQDDKNTYTLTILKDPEKGGQVSQEGSIKMKAGETVYLYATPSTGYEMDGWYINEKLMSIQNSYSYTMWNKNDTLVSRFMYKPSDPSEPGHSENKEFIVISSQSELEAYANVEEFPRSVRIIGTAITSLQSLSRMKKINGDLRIENTSLTNLEGLDNLTAITGKLIVSGNRLLVSMDGIYSWDDIFYVLIEDNPELVDYCSLTAYAQKNNPAGMIHGNAYNPTFEQIANGNCSKNDDVFKVTETSVTREPNQIHVKVKFTNEPYHYSSFTEYVSFASESEVLTLRSHSQSNLTCDFYYDAPKKEGEYTLTVFNTIGDNKGHLLNQNGNSYTGENTDNYTETFKFGGSELFVVAQAPLTGGALGEESYTDLIFNDYVENLPLANISMVSPSGKNVTIKSVEYVENISPARHRIKYGVLEEDGNYLFTLSSGVKSKNGKDMIYQYQSTIEMPSANFEPKSLKPINTNWVAGEMQQIQYVVNNVGNKPAKGKCVDVIYLSSTETWNSEAIELYRDTISVDVESQGNYAQTVSVNVPTVVDGSYYLILRTNVTHNVNELTYSDNVLSAEGVNVSVEVLSEENNRFTLQRGESRIFRIQTESDKNVEIIDKHGIANMYLGYYQLPNTDDTPNQGSITILGADAAIKYFVLVSNNGKNQAKSQQCELNVRNFELEIGNVGRNTIVKHGTAWIPVEVIGCTDIPTFYLMDSQGIKMECKKVITKTETSFFAQFETELLTPGLYSLYVESNGMTGLKQDAITVSNEPAQTSIVSKLVLPGTSRIGSTITAYIDYYNSGNVDLPAPLFILSGTEGSTYELSTGGTFTSEAHIIGVNENGVVSALMPGESNRISVNITIPNKQIASADYKLKTITEGCDGIEEPFYLQWLDVEPSEVPSCYTDEEWSAYCNRLRNNVGDTWRTFIQALGKAADMFYTEGDVNYDANCLYSLIKEMPIYEDLDNQEVANARKRVGNTLYGEEEPGTIYIWKGGWQPLVEPEYDIEYEVGNSGAERERYIFRRWKRTEHCSSLTSSRYFFISHGMNNNHKEPWIADMAAALSGKGIVICVDWGRWAKAGGIVPFISAGHISEVSSRVHDALNVAFNNNSHKDINMNIFHLIGHSHGAHVCGRLANRYRIPTKRLTALDASEEVSHTSGSQLNTRWNASYIDYYKSSVICGTEYLVGDDNFILSSGDGEFKLSLLEDTGDRKHGYSYDWFCGTINDSCNLGFNWEENRKDHTKITNHKKCWSGVINGPKNKIENYSDFYKEKKEWRYTSPWYITSSSKKKESEWDFRTAIASTFDYIVDENPLTYYGGNNYIHAGTTDWLKIKVKNNADNMTVPLNIRQSETSSHATHVLYVSKKNNNNKATLQIDKDNISSFSFNTDLYYLGTRYYYIEPGEETSDKVLNNTIDFNFTSKLWKELDGSDEEYDEFDFWLVSGIDKSSDYKSNNIRSVKLWKGELYPSDNCNKITLRVQNPNLSCEAGNDQTVKLKKGETTTNINVSGTVERDKGKSLSYFWEKAKSVFSNTKEGSISLGVGKHRLTFRIKAGNDNSTRAVSSSENEAEDDVLITVMPYTPGDEDDESTSTASSWDPNEKVSIKGAGGKSCVKPGETLEYSVFFENDAEKAQLAAQTVTVIDTLDVAFDLSTFEFTGAKASNMDISVPKGTYETCIYTDMRPNNDLILKTDMKLDIDNRIVTVIYSSLDTLTNEPTQDVFAGFLPPNDSTHAGEGFFSYRVKLKDDVSDGYLVKNQAHIFFDYNDEIATNITSNFVDCVAPISHVEKLPSTTNKDSILVEWSGIDEGSGIKCYDVYYSKNGSEFQLWHSNTADRSAFIKGNVGDRFSFYSIATDSLNYIESPKAIAESEIEFVAPLPVTPPNASISTGTAVYRGTVVELYTEDEKTKIWYTIDGSEPNMDNASVKLYSNAIVIDGDITIKAISEKIDGEKSEVATFVYSILQSQSGIELNEGWTWVSFNMVNNALNSVNSAMSSCIWTSNDIIKDMNYVDMYSPNQRQWIGTLSKCGALNNTQMYKIHSSISQKLDLAGEAVHPVETKINVGAGWNYISYLPLTTMDVNEALQNYLAEDGDVIKSQDAFAIYSSANGWEGDLLTLTPSKGYMLKRASGAKQTCFTYPVKNSIQSVNSPAKSHIYAENMNIIGKVEGITTVEGDSLMAYAYGELRGASRIERNDKVFLTIHGDDEANVVLAIQRNGEIIATATNMIGYQSNQVIGTANSPTAIRFVDTDSNDNSTGHIKAIYGINGVKMGTTNLRNIPSGLYIIYYEKNGNTLISKYLKQ